MGCERFWVSGHRLHHEGINAAKDLFWGLCYGSAVSWGQKEEPIARLSPKKHKAILAENRITSVERTE